MANLNEKAAMAIENAVCTGKTEKEVHDRIMAMTSTEGTQWKHVRSVLRGYVGVNGARIERYSGKHGDGVKVYHPNLRMLAAHGRPSTWYCAVDYVVAEC